MGVTRCVLLVGRVAIKFPSTRSWRHFLAGLLANMQEAEWWRSTRDRRLCPVRLALPGGLLVVMARANPLPAGSEIHLPYFSGLPLDPNPNNFGEIGGAVVLIDYGS